MLAKAGCGVWEVAVLNGFDICSALAFISYEKLCVIRGGKFALSIICFLEGDLILPEGDFVPFLAVFSIYLSVFVNTSSNCTTGLLILMSVC